MSGQDQPTPYPDLNYVLRNFISGVQSAFGQSFVGAWPQGQYHLSVTVEYRMDTETSARTERATYQADLSVHPDQSMDFQGSSGLCDRRTPEELELEKAREHRVFACQEAAFALAR